MAPAFTGTLPFDLHLAFLGETVTLPARLRYEAVPDWPHTDALGERVSAPLAESTTWVEVLSTAEAGGETWVTFDLWDVVPTAALDALDERIEADMRAQNAKREKLAAKRADTAARRLAAFEKLSPQYPTLSRKEIERLVRDKERPRIPAERGREILAAVMREAAAINADDCYYFRVTKLALFGSLLQGGVDGMIGDVDLGCEVTPRLVDPDERWALRLEELATAPASIQAQPFPNWSQTRVDRRLKVDRRVSLHSFDELTQFGYAHEIIFVWPAGAG